MSRALVGERLWLADVEVCRPDATWLDELDEFAEASFTQREVVSAVVTVQTVTSMSCGCDRIIVDRPYSANGPCPTVAVYAPGCSYVGCGVDRIDLAAARAAAAAGGHS